MSIVPHNAKPYNLRVYLLGKSKEAVLLRRPVVRKPKPEKSLLLAVKATGKDGRPGPSLEGGSTSPDFGVRSLKNLSEEEQQENKRRAGQRAKSRIRRKVQANDLNRMLTVTFDTNEDAKVRTRPLNRRGGDVVDDLTSWEEARYYFGLFVQRVRRKCQKLRLTCNLIAVEEVQKRGVQHFHFATSLQFTHAEWLELWGYGTVWYSGETGKRSSRRREVREPGSEVAAVSSYLTKYLAKTFDEDDAEAVPGSVRRTAGAARYHASRSLVLPFEEYLVEAGDMSALEEKLEEGGFEVLGEPLAVEKDGTIFAWWQKSVLMSMESGDWSPAPAGAARAEDAGGGLPISLDLWAT